MIGNKRLPAHNSSSGSCALERVTLFQMSMAGFVGTEGSSQDSPSAPSISPNYSSSWFLEPRKKEAPPGFRVKPLAETQLGNFGRKTCWPD